ncbi:GGDEF domain-containing protein [Metapseudomonas resinovorans]|uniref:GGDEF domain-containing protein n=1 Tax=Metapseudomonas resinovorans TaxID=53412 RepID=UPI000987C1EA|nr:GGDEF domain-containing protein [Pseudomonas resinovorans]GLZ84839.1 GGDEF domain-containing protein [Pseudomonas resinovorans]
MRPRASYRVSHFLPPLSLVVGGGVVGSLSGMNEFFTSLFNVLPTLLLLLGGAFCSAYGRVRQVALLLVVYLAYYQLDTQVDYYQAERVVREDAGLVFHLTSLLLPLLYGLYGCWEERTHLLQDFVARGAVLMAVLGVVVALGSSYPDAMLGVIGKIYWPLLHGGWMTLVQLAYLAFAIALVALIVIYVRQPRPQHAAQLLGLCGLLWMLPKTFMLPHALHVMSSLVMLALTASVVQEAYQMAFRDELTGLPGRRALNERLRRLGRNYVLAMTDVDHFKKFNDTYGHDVGDQVLRLVASRLRKVGGGGKAYRYGGEEFTILFPGKSVDDCMPHLEAVRQAIEQYQMHLRDPVSRPKSDDTGRSRRGAASGQAVSVTISIGVAERDAEQRTPEEVIKAADQALYSAKSAGRNRVFRHGENRRGAVRVKRVARS